MERILIDASEVNARIRLNEIREEIVESKVKRKYESLPLQPHLQMSSELQKSLAKYQE